MAPHPVPEMALESLSRKASAVATNVPGPQMPLYLAGTRNSELMFWVPQSGSIGLGLSILSYQGRVHFGLIADAKSIPEPGRVTARFGQQFEALLYSVLMEDWGAPIDPADAQDTLRRLCGTA